MWILRVSNSKFGSYKSQKICAITWSFRMCTKANELLILQTDLEYWSCLSHESNALHQKVVTCYISNKTTTLLLFRRIQRIFYHKHLQKGTKIGVAKLIFMDFFDCFFSQVHIPTGRINFFPVYFVVDSKPS